MSFVARWRLVPLSFLTLLGLGLPACTLLQVREEAGTFEASTVLAGRVECGSGAARPLVAAALAEDGRAVHHTALHDCGPYELLVPAGRYTVAAFADDDGDGRLGSAEALALTAAPVQAAGTGVVLVPDLWLPRAAGPSTLTRPAALQRLPARGASTQAGAVLPLSAPALSAAAGHEGYWAPVSRFRRDGGNIVFLEPYDPARVPVLFVHGAAGSPQDLAPLIERLDRRRYQAWLYHYPSGAALDSMAHLLYWKLLNLQLRHRFPQLAVVAHSMGGLVVRKLLVDLGPELAPPALFVSISTPWGGEPGAEIGVRHSPGVVPSWHDMQPGGPFLRALFQRPLPPGLEHVLLFGHRGSLSLWRPGTSSDGTVTVASQLRAEAQAGARRVLGFDEDHVGILASPQVAQLLAAALDQRLQPGAATGSAQLAVRLALPPGSARGMPLLRLKPLDGSGAPLSLLLSADDEGRAVGPLPPGRYEASLLAAGFAAQPARQALDLRPGATATLALALQAQGTLQGYVGDAHDAAQVAAGVRVPPHAGLRLAAVTLKGPGVERRLVPRPALPTPPASPAPPGSLEELVERAIDGQDAAAGAAFSFVGLPAGDYELLVEAEGRTPHRSRHRIEPGRPGAPLVLLLPPPR